MTEQVFSLKDKVAIITGASKGIGKAIAQNYAEQGAKVVLASRTQNDLDLVAAEIKDAGGDAYVIVTDMTDNNQVIQLVKQTKDRYGSVDIVVNNAGASPHFGPLLSAEEKHWERTFDVNLMGYVRLAKAAVPVMKSNGGGKIINVSSVAGKRAQPGMGVYCVSKAGVIMLTEVMAVELARDNIQVNCLAPGFIKTDLSKPFWSTDGLNSEIVKTTPASRFASTDELKGITLYLASDASSFTTGATFVVDGGLLVQSGLNLF